MKNLKKEAHLAAIKDMQESKLKLYYLKRQKSVITLPYLCITLAPNALQRLMDASR